MRALPLLVLFIAVRRLCGSYLEPAAERVVIFHLITEGECYVELGDDPPVRLMAGDVVVFPKGDAHRMTSRPVCRLPPAAPGWKRCWHAVLDSFHMAAAARPRESSVGIWLATLVWRACCWPVFHAWCESTCADRMPALGSKRPSATHWRRLDRRDRAVRACLQSLPRFYSSRCCAYT